MRKITRAILFTGFLTGIIWLSVPVYSLTINFPNPLQNNTLDDIVSALTDLLFRIAVVIVPLLIIYAGFLIVTAGGSPEQASKGRKLIVWTSIGFVFILLFRGLFDLVLGLLGL